MEKRNRPLRYLQITWCILLLGACMVLFGAVSMQDNRINALLIVGIVVCIAGVAFGLITVRCKACGQLLIAHRPLPPECPYCGAKFE